MPRRRPPEEPAAPARRRAARGAFAEAAAGRPSRVEDARSADEDRRRLARRLPDAADAAPRDAHTATAARQGAGRKGDRRSKRRRPRSERCSPRKRRLVKLGFVLKPDGVMGATTRQAIERYERDHHRVSNGELTPAVMRRLSAESGEPIN